MLKKLFPILLFFTLGLLSLTWFRESQYLFGVDTIFPVSAKGISEYFSIWSNRVLYSEADIFKLPLVFPLFLVLRLWISAGLPYSGLIAERILLYVLFSFSGYSVYFLISKVFKNISFKLTLLGGFLYMFSFYFMYLVTPVPFFLIFTYTFFPFVLGLYISNFSKSFSFIRSLIYAFISFLLLVPSYATPPYFVLHLFLFSFCTLFIFFRNRISRINIFKNSLAFGFLFCFFNLFWIIPVVLAPRNQIETYMIVGDAPYASYKNNSVKVMNAVRQQGYFGMGGEYKHTGYYGWFEIYKNPIVVILTLVVPLFLILGIYFVDFSKVEHNNKSFFLLFSSLFILFCFLLTFPSAPYFGIFKDLFEKVGFFYMFRTAYQRFSSYVLLCMVLCFVFVLDYFYKNLDLSKRKFLNIFTFIVIVLNLLQVHPLLLGTVFDKNKIFPSIRSSIPQYWLDFTSYMDSKPDSRSMVLPLNELGLYSYWWDGGTNGYAGVYPLTNLSTSRNLYLGNFFKELIKYTSSSPSGISMFMRAHQISSVIFYNDLAWHLVQDNTWNSNDSFIDVKRYLQQDPCLTKSNSYGPIDIYDLKEVCHDFTDVSLHSIDSGVYTKNYTKIPDSSTILKLMSDGNYYFSSKSTAVNNSLISVTPVTDLFVGDSYWNNNWVWPDASIDPKSYLYPFVRLKENIVLSFSSKEDYSYSDSLTWLISKRIEEQEKFKTTPESLPKMLQNLEKSFRGPLKNRTDILNKSVLYLRRASKYTTNSQTKQLLTDSIASLKSIWKIKREDCLDFCYSVYSPESTEYKILFKDSNLPYLKNYKIFVNSKELGQAKDGITFNLSGGSSLISFSRISATNLLEGIPSIDHSGINYQFPSNIQGTPIVKEISFTNLVPNSTYEFTFDYDLSLSHFQFLTYNFKTDFALDPGLEKMLEFYSSGITPNTMLRIEKKNDLYVDAKNGKRSSYTSTFNTGSAISKDGKVVFNIFPDKRSLNYSFKVSNFKLIKKEVIEFSLLNLNSIIASKQNLVTKRLTPYLYEVQLPDTLPDSFVLSLDEKTDAGWQVYTKTDMSSSFWKVIENFGDSLLGFRPTPHMNLLHSSNFEFNFVKNGWEFHKQDIPLGTKVLYLYYYPQRYLAISVLCITVFTGLLLTSAIIWSAIKYVKTK